MSDDRPTTAVSFWGRLGRALAWLLRFALRLTFVLLIGAALGVGAYFGAIFLYRQYIEPAQVNTIRLDVLTGRQEQTTQRLTDRLDDMQVRVEDLEVQGDQVKETRSSLEARLAAMETEWDKLATALDTLQALRADLGTLQAALQGLEDAHQAISADLESLQSAQGAEETDLDALQASLGKIEEALAALRTEVESTQAQVASVQAEVSSLSDTVFAYGEDIVTLGAELSGENSPAVLLRELQLVKAMELLSRSRLLLVQNNVGLAQADIQAGQRLLIDLQPEVPDYQAEVLTEIVDRLDAALEALPASPVAAADELEGAWQLLIAGLPAESLTAAEAEATPVPEGTVVPPTTPTAEPTPTETPTATPTPTPQS